MATVYSLICFGGKDGKTVTFTDAGDVVNLTSHGLRDGTGVVFTDNAGNTLPTGLSKNTTYYSKQGADANKFTLWTTSGLTTQVTFTGTGTGTHKVKSAYYYNLSDKSRWTTSGTERIYDGLVSWKAARNAAATAFDPEVAEIGMGFVEDYTGGTFTAQVTSAPSTIITSLVNGSRSTAMHDVVSGNGFSTTTLGNGYVIKLYLFSVGNFTTIDGITVAAGTPAQSDGLVSLASSVESIVKNNFVYGGNTSYCFGISCNNDTYSRVENNIVIAVNNGIVNFGANFSRISGNIISKCTTGVSNNGATTFRYGYWYNNISVGNTTNWQAEPTTLQGASNNYGLVTDTPWAIGSGTVGVIATTDFVDHTNNDYRPAAITSPQVENGLVFYGQATEDIAGTFRPAYPGSAYNTAVTAGSFVAGLSYTIATKGTTDFTACGATTNAVTFTDSGDTVGWTAHPFSNGDLIYFSVITTTTGISIDTLYYVVGKATNTFQVALTAGGSAITLTTNGTGTVVLPTFKATGVGTGTGAATLNAKYDVGPYEYDLGYGSWPNTVTVAGSGIVDGTRIKIAKQSDGTEIRNEVLSSETTDSFTYDTPTDVDVYIYARKGSATPYYKPLKLATTILADGGLTYNLSGLQIEDIAAATYTAGVATDWTFNSGTGAITHASGTTRYSVQDLYSWHQDYYDDSATVDDNPLINGITPTQFELINSGSISDGDLEDLFGGSVEFSNGTLWSNLYTAGSLAASHALYVVQNGSKVTSFWSAGHIDILVKVSNAGVEIDNGQVTVYARPYGYSYAHYLVDMSAGGRNVAPISTLADPTTTAISSATAATYSDITISFGTTSHDLGEGGGAGSYRCDIDCAGRTLDQVYAYLMYLTRDASTATLNGESGWKYQKANSAYTANAAAPFGTYAGGFFTVAQGVWLTNYAASETYNFVLTDHAGVTHQLIEPTNQSVTISGATAGSRIQIYDTTSLTELYNGTPVFPYTWSDGSAAVADRAIRLRVSYVSGTSAKNFIEASIGTCGQTAETKDVSYLVSQSNDTTYNSNGINGPAIYATSGITFTDAATDLVNCNIAGGSVTYPTIYACFVYWNFTAVGIANDFTYISAPDTANYLLSGMKIRNTSATDLVVTGGYGRDATSGLSSDIIDTAGSTGNIFLAPDHVVPYATGSGVTSQDKIDIAAQVLTAAASAPIYAEIIKVAGETVTGSGTELDPWGPA